MAKTERNTQATRRILFGIISAGMVLRAGLAAAYYGGWMLPDSEIFFEMGSAILEGRPVSALANGYPVLIALVKAIGDTGNATFLMMLLNVVFGGLTVYLAFRLGMLIRNTELGLTAAAAVALFPNQILHTRFLLPEVFGTAVLMGAMLLLINDRSFGGGVMTYLASLVRPALMPVGLALLVVMAVFKNSTQAIFRYSAGLAAGLLIYLAAVLAGIVQPPESLSYHLAISERAAQTAQTVEEFEDIAHDQAVQVYFRSFLSNPDTFLAERMTVFWHMWGPWSVSAHEPYAWSWWERVLTGLRFPLLLLALCAVASRPREQVCWVLMTPVIILTIVHAGFYATLHATVVVEPLLLVLASKYLYELDVRSRWIRVKNRFRPTSRTA